MIGKTIAHYEITALLGRGGMGEVGTALDWLERAFDEHDQTLVWVKVHPRLDPLRSERRYDELLRRMNL